ncbi:MAG: Methyltransferase type 11 [Myxococcaceae bacterium]|nr:Methyltransferase type 11 [Myxococcaceae bacterium]
MGDEMALPDSNNRAYYDDFSTSYERERGAGYHQLIDDIEVDAVRELAHGKTVLEAGCGTGLVLSRLAQVASSAHGFDLSLGMVQRARARGLSVALGSVTSVPFRDDSFDLVCSFKVLAHVPDITEALRELARVTRPGGMLALEFYNPWSLRYAAKRIAGPGQISEGRTEADVYTRWDTPFTIPKLLPKNLELLDYRGVRVVTPAAFVHKLPGVRHAFAAAERASVRSPLRYFGGFLVALLRKHKG